MGATIVIPLIFIVLFIAAYFSKRRLGLLGLALSAGFVLSGFWSTDAGLMVSALGIVPNGPMTNTVTLAAVVLLPAIVLLFHGASYTSKIMRLFGSIVFASLAVAFLLTPLQFSLDLSGSNGHFFTILNQQKGIVISVGLILAIFDLFLTKPVHRHDKLGRR